MKSRKQKIIESYLSGQSKASYMEDTESKMCNIMYTILAIIMIIILGCTVASHILKIESTYENDYFVVNNSDYTKFIKDGQNALPKEELNGMLQCLQENGNGIYKVYFLSIDVDIEKENLQFCLENKLYQIMDDKDIKSAKCSCINHSHYYENFAVALVYNKFDNQYYVAPLKRTVLNTHAFDGLDKSSIDDAYVVGNIGVDFVSEENIMIVTSWYEERFQDKSPSEMFCILMEDLKLNSFLPDDNKDEILHNIPRNYLLIGKYIWIIIYTSIIFLIAWFLLCCLFETILNTLTHDKIFDYYVNTVNEYKKNEEDRIKKEKQEAKEAKEKEAELLKAKESETKWTIIYSIVDNLLKINPDNNDIITKRDDLIKKLLVVNDIMVKRKDDNEVKSFLNSYKTIYFPILNNALIGMIDNAETYHSEFNSSDEIKLLNKTLNSYSDMMDYIIEHSNDTKFMDLESNIDAAISAAKMNGILPTNYNANR